MEAVYFAGVVILGFAIAAAVVKDKAIKAVCLIGVVAGLMITIGTARQQGISNIPAVDSNKLVCAISLNTGWASDEPTPAQFKEFFTQVESGRITKERLQDFLEGKEAVVDSVSSIFVDYTKPLAEMIREGHFDYKDPNITEENFPKMKVFSTEELVGKTRSATSEEIIQAMTEKGYRLAELPELLAYGVVNPDEQRKYPIVTFGSVRQYWSSYRSVPYLLRWNDEPGLALRLFEDDWNSYCRFLAVRK